MRTTYMKTLTLALAVALLPLLSGCFGAIDELDKFFFQLAANYQATFTNRSVPDSEVELVDLNKYQTYRENKEN